VFSVRYSIAKKNALAQRKRTLRVSAAVTDEALVLARALAWA
jgi:hypothetical protein